MRREEEIADLYSSQPQVAERGHRAHMLQRLNDMQASQEQYTRQIDTLKLENSRLKGEVERSRNPHYSHPHGQHWNESGRDPKGSFSGSGRVESRRGHLESGHSGPPSWDMTRNYYSNTEGFSSLPESLSSCSSGSSTGQTTLTAALTELSLTGKPSPPPPDATATELKKIKKQLEKYKTANIDLDERLKEAKLELRKYSERGTEAEVRYRMDCERLRAENTQLRLQLDRALSESNHFRSLVGRRY